jgi:hypothetical protein
MRALAPWLIAGLLACSGADQVASRRPVQERGDWEGFRDRLPTDPRAAAAALEQYRERHGLLLTFWPRDGAPEALMQGLTTHPHPCGESLQAFVKAIPHDDPVLDAELVVEFDEAGRVVRRWRIPIDVMVAGVRGDRVLVPAGIGRHGENLDSLYLAVAPDGDYEVVADVASDPGQPFDCPELTEFQGSDYLGCWRFHDGASVRRIAHQYVCT